METIEEEVRDIFNKTIITGKDLARANDLIRVWKEINHWQEDVSNPIKAY
jgi:hypothetical protein